MLEFSASSPPSLPEQVAKPPKRVTGKRLAKASCGYPWWARAEDAAGWMLGEVVVVPTAKLACAVFGVSYPRLKKGQALIGWRAQHKHPVNGHAAPALSDEAIERFIAKAGVDRIWNALDRLTQPATQAAE